jgi:hypothetical protein
MAKREQVAPEAPQQSTAALAPQPAAALSTEHAQLAAVLNDTPIEDDGLSEIGAEDIKLPVKVFNFKGVDQAGDPIPPNVFYDTVTETTAKTLDVMLLNLHKTNEWTEFSNEKDRNEVRCRSFDQVTGEMADGTKRPCKGCPDAKWTTVKADDGTDKRSRRCGPVYNMFAAELPTRQPCVFRFKRTALPVVQTYLNRHHIGRRTLGNRRVNWPLFVFKCRVALKMSDNKKYALPVLDNMGDLSPEEIALGAATVPYIKNVLLGELAKVIENERDNEPDTSFDTSKMGGDAFAADEGQAFVDAEAG